MKIEKGEGDTWQSVGSTIAFESTRSVRIFCSLLGESGGGRIAKGGF